MVRQLSIKELEEYLDDDLLKLVKLEEVDKVYYIKSTIIASYEKFFSTFLPSYVKYFVVVSRDLPNKLIKESLIRAKDPLEVSCYISAKLPEKSILIVGLQMNNIKKKEEVKEKQPLLS
ncbi:DUF4898 domain-containing protein [Sulfolobus tengchongensis]|uniref:DUF4898 domain-containing protein n=1 Tax=Sulfolobus tengchongensis TaxID=207809 RepID=A0AAX4L3W2_9CREN